MTTPARTRLNVDERRAQLLELGMRLFGTRSYDEVSIDAIAEEAGVSKGLLYHYFGSKRAFYLATVTHAAGQLLQSLAAIGSAQTGPARARAGLAAYLDFVEEHGHAYSAMVSGGIGADPEVAALLETTRAAIVQQILSDVGLTETRPTFELAMRHYIGGVEATALDWHARRHIDRDTMLAFLVEQIRSTLEVALRLDPDASVTLEDEPENGC